MQYVRYGKPTGTSMASIKKSMKGKSRLAPFVPSRPFANARLNAQELKGVDTSIATTIDSTTEVINNTLNLITQGDSFNNREGATVMLKSIEITGRLDLLPATATSSTGVAYIWIVLDRQPNGAAATATGTTGYLTSANAYEALPTIPLQYRFKTLGKICVDLTAQAGVSGAYNPTAKPISFYKKFKKPIEVRFTGNAGSIADIATNNIFLVAGSSDVDDLISFGGTARVRFTG